jgi:hypothetical protein
VKSSWYESKQKSAQRVHLSLLLVLLSHLTQSSSIRVVQLMSTISHPW